MALINCNECGKQISDKAAVCPQCGAPVQSHKIKPELAVTFRDPHTGPIKRIDQAGLWTFLLGPIYFLANGVWTHALLSTIAALITYGLSWLIYPLFAKSVMRSALLSRGWVAEKDVPYLGHLVQEPSRSNSGIQNQLRSQPSQADINVFGSPIGSGEDRDPSEPRL